MKGVGCCRSRRTRGPNTTSKYVMLPFCTLNPPTPNRGFCFRCTNKEHPVVLNTNSAKSLLCRLTTANPHQVLLSSVWQLQSLLHSSWKASAALQICCCVHAGVSSPLCPMPRVETCWIIQKVLLWGNQRRQPKQTESLNHGPFATLSRLLQVLTAAVTAWSSF